MKLVIFGASGRTGLPLVQQALDAGHEVVAFVRDPGKVPIAHDRLTFVQGDVMNAAEIENAITQDVDAVLSVLGPVKGSPDTLLPTAAQNIIHAMQSRGVQRLIYMTGTGVHMPQDKPKLLNHIIRFALKTFAGDVLKRSEKAVRLVQNSGLHWTIVRGPMLTDGVHSGRYRVGWVGVNTGPRLARADAADFMLKQLTDEAYIH